LTPTDGRTPLIIATRVELRQASSLLMADVRGSTRNSNLGRRKGPIAGGGGGEGRVCQEGEPSGVGSPFALDGVRDLS
jgi:hypothetical protein